MNYYKASQRNKDKRWDYTKNGMPIGYCKEYCELDSNIESFCATKHKHHTEGHETKEEACECYKEYLLDHRLILDRKMSNQQLKCEICKEWTNGFAEIDCNIFTLCPKHNNRKSVEEIMGEINESYSSW